MHGGAASRRSQTMAAEGALCGFIFLEGSTWVGPEDTEALAPVTLGIPNGLGKWEWGGLRTGQCRTTPLPAGSAPWCYLCESSCGLHTGFLC